MPKSKQNVTAFKPIPTIELAAWEDKLGSALEWAGNCYGIAQGAIQAGLVYGKARYGLWIGAVAAGSMFYGKPVIHHGWVELEDERVVDPTRWEFESKLPYIYVGQSDYYDVGGNLLKRKFVKPCPKFDPKATKFYPLPVGIRALIPRSRSNMATGEQVFWMANLPVDELLPHAKPLLRFLTRARLSAFLPTDNYDLILEAVAKRNDR